MSFTRADLEAMPRDQFLELHRQVLSIFHRSYREHKAVPGSMPHAMSVMAIGETQVFANTKMHHDSRAAARKYMGDPNAQWSARTLNHGIRVTRIR